MSLFRIASRLVASSSTSSLLWNRKLFHVLSALFTNLVLLDALANRQVHRWVMPTLREIRKRRNKIGPLKPVPRSDFIEWNYDAELYAFGVRLKEKFTPSLLQQAFVDRSYIVQEEMKQRAVGIETPVLQLTDNSNLVQKGDELLTEFIITYLNVSLPKFPREGVKAVYNHLVSEEVLAKVSSHLGTKELILAAKYPPPPAVLVKSLKAVIGALFESSGEARAFEFIRDFIITQLNQVDINEFWTIEDPVELMKEICKDKKLGEPEPRLISEIGRNTLLAAYQVGFYCNKQMIGAGFGEDITIATEQAAKNALQRFFRTEDNAKPFDFDMPVEIVMKALSKPAVATIDKM